MRSAIHTLFLLYDIENVSNKCDEIVEKTLEMGMKTFKHNEIIIAYIQMHIHHPRLPPRECIAYSSMILCKQFDSIFIQTDDFFWRGRKMRSMQCANRMKWFQMYETIHISTCTSSAHSTTQFYLYRTLFVRVSVHGHASQMQFTIVLFFSPFLPMCAVRIVCNLPVCLLVCLFFWQL